MSLRKETPCDWGDCPYMAMYPGTCEYYCGLDEPEDEPEMYEEEEE